MFDYDSKQNKKWEEIKSERQHFNFAQALDFYVNQPVVSEPHILV